MEVPKAWRIVSILSMSFFSEEAGAFPESSISLKKWRSALENGEDAFQVELLRKGGQ